MQLSLYSHPPGNHTLMNVLIFAHISPCPWEHKHRCEQISYILIHAFIYIWFIYVCYIYYVCYVYQFSSVAQSCPTLRLQHARPPCPSPTPGVYSDSCPSSQWCHPAISSSVVPFSSRLQSFPTSGSFLVSQFFQSGDKVLEFQLQHQSFQWIFRIDFL